MGKERLIQGIANIKWLLLPLLLMIAEFCYDGYQYQIGRFPSALLCVLYMGGIGMLWLMIGVLFGKISDKLATAFPVLMGVYMVIRGVGYGSEGMVYWNVVATSMGVMFIEPVRMVVRAITSGYFIFSVYHSLFVPHRKVAAGIFFITGALIFMLELMITFELMPYIDISFHTFLLRGGAFLVGYFLDIEVRGGSTCLDGNEKTI